MRLEMRQEDCEWMKLMQLMIQEECAKRKGKTNEERRFRAMQATYSNRPTKYFVCPEKASFHDAL